MIYTQEAGLVEHRGTTGATVTSLDGGGHFFAQALMAPDPHPDEDLPFDRGNEATRAAQAELEAALKPILDAAQYLMKTHGTETGLDDITLLRECPWTSPDGQTLYKLQQKGTPSDGGRRKKWDPPIVFSVSDAGAKEGEYLTRVNLSPKQLAVQSQYVGKNSILGGTSDEILTRVGDLIGNKAAAAARVRGGRVGGVVVATTATHVINSPTPPASESAPTAVQPESEAVAAVPEMPRVQMPEALIDRLRLAGYMRGRERPSGLTHDGFIPEVAADLGYEPISDPGAPRGEAARLYFEAVYGNTSQNEITPKTLPDAITMRLGGSSTHFRVLPDGGLTPFVQGPNDTMDNLDTFLQEGLTQLDKRLEHFMEEVEYAGPVRDRVTLLMDRVSRAQATQSHSGQPLFRSGGPMRVGEDEIDLSIREVAEQYEVSLGIVSPDGQPPYTRQLIIPKNRQQALHETSADTRHRMDIEDLVNNVLDHALRPTRIIAQEVASEGNEYHQAYLTVDEVMTNAGARVLYGRSEEIGPHISRVQWHTIFGPDGKRYLIQRFGRLGEHGQIDWLYTRVQQGLYPAYELTRNGFIPTKAYRGGVTPRMTRRQREIAEAEFEQFAAALEFNARQAH